MLRLSFKSFNGFQCLPSGIFSPLPLLVYPARTLVREIQLDTFALGCDAETWVVIQDPPVLARELVVVLWL